MSARGTIRVAPSILAADFLELGAAVAAVGRGGAGLLHVDVMDGRFVPALSIGLPIVEALARAAKTARPAPAPTGPPVTADAPPEPSSAGSTSAAPAWAGVPIDVPLPIDVHLMVVEPERHVDAFAEAGASMLSVHLEASPHLHRTLSTIRAVGAAAGVALNPGTPVGALEAVADQVDYVVVMSVNPGAAGQPFLPGSFERVRAVRALLDRAGNRAPVEIDGGVGPANAAALVEAGAEILVAASAIFGAPDPAAATRRLCAAASGSTSGPAAQP